VYSIRTSVDIRLLVLRKIYGHNWFESVPLQPVDILGRENLHPLDSQTLRHNQKVTTSGSFQLPPFPSGCCAKVKAPLNVCLQPQSLRVLPKRAPLSKAMGTSETVSREACRV